MSDSSEELVSMAQAETFHLIVRQSSWERVISISGF
jgi:hypothetical protein